MKIAQVNVFYYPVLAGGAEWYVYNVSRELVKRGHEVHVYAGNSSYGNKDLQDNEDIDGVIVHRLPFWMNLTYRAKIWKGLDKRLLQEKFDLIHTYDYAQMHSYSAIKIGKKGKVPSALTVFDVHSMIPRPFYKSIPMKIFDKYFARIMLSNADGVLVRAPNLVDALLGMGAKADRTFVTPSGIEEEALQQRDGSAFLEKYSIMNHPVIMYLGRLHPMKGPQYIIEAATEIVKKFPNAFFVFIGPDHVDYKNYLQQLSEKLGLSDKVLFTGQIDDFEMKMQAFAASELFVLPSGYEGTSQSIFQAMASSKPIVATNRGGIPFQVENLKEAILVEYGDVKSMASAILRLLEDKELAVSLGSRAKEKVKHFTYPILVNQLEEIYDKLIKSNNAK